MEQGVYGGCLLCPLYPLLAVGSQPMRRYRIMSTMYSINCKKVSLLQCWHNFFLFTLLALMHCPFAHEDRKINQSFKTQINIRNPRLTAKVIFIASIPPFNLLYMGTFSHGSSVLLRLFVNTTVPKVVPILFGNYKAFGPPTSRCNLKKSLLSFQFAFDLASF